MKAISGEWPNPLSACPGFSFPVGLPVTLQLGPFVTPALTAYSLSKNDSSPVPLQVCAFDAETYINPDSSQQDRARRILAAYGAIVLIPRRPLEPGYYNVSITAGATHSWQFKIY